MTANRIDELADAIDMGINNPDLEVATEPAYAALSELVATAKAGEAARIALTYECPRTAHVNGCDPRPDGCEKVGATADTCNIAHGLGWEACPEYPAHEAAEKVGK